MKHAPFTSLLVLGILSLGTTAARADPIQWGYDWSANPTQLTAGNSSANYVQMSTEGFQTAKGNSRIVAANLDVFSTSPNAFSATEGLYSLTLNLTDINTLATGNLTFGGQLQGDFSPSTSNVSNHFSGPTTQTLALNDSFFTVTVDSFTSPGPPNQGHGSIGAKVTVQSIHQNLPEPSSMTLAGMGVAAGVLAWRRRKRRLVAA